MAHHLLRIERQPIEADERDQGREDGEQRIEGDACRDDRQVVAIDAILRRIPIKTRIVRHSMANLPYKEMEKYAKR